MLKRLQRFIHLKKKIIIDVLLSTIKMWQISIFLIIKK